MRDYIGFKRGAERPNRGLCLGLEGELTMLLSIIRALKAFRDYQKNLNELSQLSDHELADIGLRRSEIQAVAAGTYRK
jgi:uncharacterized protein YjiS (DUF1127 family)